MYHFEAKIMQKPNNNGPLYLFKKIEYVKNKVKKVFCSTEYSMKVTLICIFYLHFLKKQKQKRFATDSIFALQACKLPDILKK